MRQHQESIAFPMGKSTLFFSIFKKIFLNCFSFIFSKALLIFTAATPYAAPVLPTNAQKNNASG